MDYKNVIKAFMFVNEVLSNAAMSLFVENFFEAREDNEEAVMADFISYLTAAAEEKELPADLKRLIVFEAKDRLEDMAKN